MAVSRQQQIELVLLLVIVFVSDIILGQYTQWGYGYPPNQQNPYDVYGAQQGPYNIPNPGDKDYRTFVYKGRSYGLGNSYSQGIPGDPRLGNADPIFPGILGGWREDLQGKRRDQTKELQRDIFVRTTHGEVQGFQVYLFDNPSPESLYRPGAEFIERQMGIASVFLGIPYAQAPTNNDGRFKPPRLHRGWQLIQAVDFGPACPQPEKYTGYTMHVRDMDEDCLYLNVYTPNIQEGIGQKYPVMVYIHGGDFIHGASNLFPGHIMATFYKVVVVTFNYRLGALGFLSTGDVNSPGNYGILDQAMALQWVFENAEKFNGDRYSITLFGPGAGAASAGLLMVAPETRNIVTKVIAQSGSAVADWAMIFDRYRAQNTSRVFGRQIGCSIESSWRLVNCLRTRSAFEIGKAEFPPEVGLFPWAPVIEMNVSMPYYEGWYENDWHFLNESVETLIRKRMFHPDLRYMSSVTLQEAATFITSNQSLAPYFEIDQNFFDQKVWELVMRYNYTLNAIGTFNAIKYMYTYWPDPNNKTMIREKYIQLLTDFLYTAPNDKMVKLLVEQNVPVYMYVLNTTVESFQLSEWRKVPHNIEHYLLCGAPFLDVEMLPPKERFVRNQWTNNDRNMSHFFMKAYTDFARYGNPTHTQILGIHFEEAKNGQLKYLNLNTTYNSSIMWNFRQTESAFWTMYIPQLVGHLVPTYPPTTEFWWEPTTPLQIAFWSMSGFCLFLIVLLVLCCMLWRNAKRSKDRYYNPYLYPSDTENEDGVENTRDPDEYSEKLRPPVAAARTNSQSSFQTVSMKEMQGFVTPSPTEEVSRRATPVVQPRTRSRSQSNILQGVPQTDV